MGKAAGAIGASFALGSGMMGLLGPILGSFAEVVSLGLMGVGLIACSGLLGARANAKLPAQARA